MESSTWLSSVNDVNDPPVSQDVGPFSTQEGVAVSIILSATDVEDNDLFLDYLI